MNKFPKRIYVTHQKDHDCEWMQAVKNVGEAIDDCEGDCRVGIYELKEVGMATITKTLEVQK